MSGDDTQSMHYYAVKELSGLYFDNKRYFWSPVPTLMYESVANSILKALLRANNPDKSVKSDEIYDTTLPLIKDGRYRIVKIYVEERKCKAQETR